jgi:alkyl sulfatase BDS1-like metallo-beta-lactamase superfamily hydrolase
MMPLALVRDERRQGCPRIPTRRSDDMTPATDATRRANEELLARLPFGDTDDFDLAERGFLAALPDTVTTGDGRPVWDSRRFDFVDGDAPDTVNPSLWRQERLSGRAGLFEVTERIYQVRSLDLSNISFVRGATGWIVLDPLITAEVAAAALELVNDHVERLPVTAVVFSHSHADHFGGVRGVCSPEDVAAGRVRIVAPEGFTFEAVSENVMAGNAMTRRASYMYGNLLPPSPTGQVGAGLGKTTSTGTFGLLEPTDHVGHDVDSIVLDGVELRTLYTPDTEAPAEFVFLLPAWGALWTAEVVTHVQHNLYTLRGAQVRDALAWAKSIDTMIARFGADTELVFASHHWPTWGHDASVALLRTQRDTYRYLHDETLRLANRGETMLEIAERLELPPVLARTWSSRGYYGSVNHNVKAIYQRYLGFFDGNPATLHPHPPVEAAQRYVAYMGGADAILARARADHEAGDDRWVAEVVKHVVFADPGNQAARELLADALTQLGYRAESGPWRNFYLTGAKELRDGVMVLPTPTTSSPDVIAAMPTSLILDYLAIRLEHPEATELAGTTLLELTDVGERHLLELSNGVLHNRTLTEDEQVATDATFTTTRTWLDALLATDDPAAALTSGTGIAVEGDASPLLAVFALLDDFPFWFDIVTP